ncbi:MAG: CPBP family intramembrane metalloprotease, partial [Deltaproteobacteria bacterium]|nr:CPBP family intramembrane metalloprotease [Kofleriaceae bacterium]
DRTASRAAWYGHGDLGASLVLVFPLVLAYGIGALLAGTISAVDLPSRALWRACGADRATYLLVYAALAAGFLVWIGKRGRRAALTLDVAAPVVMEAAIYGLTLAAVIDVILARALGLGAGNDIVAALGAGIHEELLFRLGAFAGAGVLLARAGLAPRAAWLLAFVGSSLLFAAAHHWAGEPWDERVFAFRVLAGAAFGLVFWFRSLAHAVWAHALYDVYVALVR